MRTNTLRNDSTRVELFAALASGLLIMFLTAFVVTAYLFPKEPSVANNNYPPYNVEPTTTITHR